MSVRTLVIVGDPVPPPPADRACQPGPRRDYQELVDRLGADVLHAGQLVEQRDGRFATGLALARLAAARASFYENIYCDSEHIGVPLAFLLRRRPGPRLTMIAHYLTPAKKAIPVRLLRLHRRFSRVVLHSPAQFARARAMGFRADQLVLVPYQVDSAYWRPSAIPPSGRPYIASAGQEFRDYRTLVDAAARLDVDVEIAAGSHWSTRARNVDDRGLPSNVRIRRRSYPELRTLYAGAAFVVVPLHDVDFQAGVITILEAMAMGKAVIVSRTRGQRGVVSGPLLEHGVARDIGEGGWPADTGFYVPPANVASLRAATTHLLDRPALARELGAAGRRRVEHEFTLERFVDRMADVIEPHSTAMSGRAS